MSYTFRINNKKLFYQNYSELQFFKSSPHWFQVQNSKCNVEAFIAFRCLVMAAWKVAIHSNLIFIFCCWVIISQYRLDYSIDTSLIVKTLNSKNISSAIRHAKLKSFSVSLSRFAYDWNFDPTSYDEFSTSLVVVVQCLQESRAPRMQLCGYQTNKNPFASSFRPISNTFHSRK